MITNTAKLEVMKGSFDLLNDAIKVILMKENFIFNPDTHSTYGDIAASELITNFGYIAGGVVLANPVPAIDQAGDVATVSYDDPAWVAAGGDIGPSIGAMVYDSSTPTSLLIGYIGFGTPQHASDGGTFKLTNMKIRSI